MARLSLDELMKATTHLGDVVVDPATWPGVMDAMSRAVRAEGAILLQSDGGTPDVPRTASISDLADIYFSKRWDVGDVRTVRSVRLRQRGQLVVIDQDILSLAEMRKNRTYNDFYIPNGFQWFASVSIFAGTGLWGIPFQRTIKQGPFEEEDKRVLAQLSRRLSEAATLSQAVSRSVLTGTVNALNLVRQPALILDRSGFVLDANAAAEQIFDSEIRITNRQLTLSAQGARAELQRLVDALRATGDTTPLPTDPIVVQRNTRPPVLIRVLPIEAAARSPFLGARVMLIMLDLSDHKPPSSKLLTASFGLTAAEAKIAGLIGAGETVARAAQQLRISVHTARTHLKAVSGKTDTHRQAELAALVARLRGFP